jgi:hypothetical protein
MPLVDSDRKKERYPDAWKRFAQRATKCTTLLPMRTFRNNFHSIDRNTLLAMDADARGEATASGRRRGEQVL